MNVDTCSTDLVYLAYRLLKHDIYYHKMDLFLRSDVAAYEAGDSLQQRQERDYATIIAMARKGPPKILQEDLKFLMWHDQAITRTGEEI